MEDHTLKIGKLGDDVTVFVPPHNGTVFLFDERAEPHMLTLGKHQLPLHSAVRWDGDGTVLLGTVEKTAGAENYCVQWQACRDADGEAMPIAPAEWNAAGDVVPIRQNMNAMLRWHVSVLDLRPLGGGSGGKNQDADCLLDLTKRVQEKVRGHGPSA